MQTLPRRRASGPTDKQWSSYIRTKGGVKDISNPVPIDSGALRKVPIVSVEVGPRKKWPKRNSSLN